MPGAMAFSPMVEPTYWRCLEGQSLSPRFTIDMNSSRVLSSRRKSPWVETLSLSPSRSWLLVRGENRGFGRPVVAQEVDQRREVISAEPWPGDAAHVRAHLGSVVSHQAGDLLL